MKAREFTFDVGTDADGNMSMTSEQSDKEAIRLAVEMLCGRLGQAAPELAGFKCRGGSIFIRSVEGQGHPEFTIPRMSARQNDGTFPDESN